MFYWKQRVLLGEVSFLPTEAGFDSFRDYLRESINIPAKFLIDVIEEDFRIETVPHVGSKDRKAVISRLIDRYYRSGQQYCYDEVIGRIKTGRRDDKVLIGAMTNPRLIQPWLDIIEKNAVPLSGIWTLPLVSRLLLSKISAQKGMTLLVSQQVNSNVRQSLFCDGKLLSSRQSIINQDINDTRRIGEYAAPEVEKTLLFLRNQGLLSNNDVVNLHIIGNDQQITSLQKAFISDERQRVFIHSTRNIIGQLKLNNVKGNFSDSIFSWLCCNQGYSFSHYGELLKFNRYFYSIASTILYVASVIILVLGFLLTESNISTALGNKEEIAWLKAEAQEYKNIYLVKFKKFEGLFEDAGIMQSVVKLAKRIKHNGKTSPLDFMIHLSQILSDKKLPEFQLDKIEWWPVQTDSKHHVTTISKDKAVNFTEKTAILNRAIIKGRIDVSKTNYRKSINQIDEIIAALRKDPQIISVEAKTIPVDLRSSSKFSTESGADIKHKKTSESGGMFSLQITMRASTNG